MWPKQRRYQQNGGDREHTPLAMAIACLDLVVVWLRMVAIERVKQ